ncbi:MAG: flavodoxin-dependent (E)-4-hydroxy-3-methylbut-2-enyl-diphosphate synthase [Acidobacteriota bacterium]
MADLKRRQTPSVWVGGVPIGGCHPIVIQSMTNTQTADVEATVDQVLSLAAAGSELVRATVNNKTAAAAIPRIIERLREQGCEVPIVGDFHYNGHILLKEHPEAARLLAKYRINPGNVGVGNQHDDNFRAMVMVAIHNAKPVRIGVNGGSVDQALLAKMMDDNSARSEPMAPGDVLAQAIVRSAVDSARQAEHYGLSHDRIILSAKVSDVQELVSIHRALAAECDYPIHLGLTEAGMGIKGVVSSTAALAILLQEGIGDTIRVSLTPAPGGDRAEEVRVSKQILQSLGIRRFTPQVTACPGCGRTSSQYFQELAQQVERHIERRLHGWRQQYPGVVSLRIAVMGCVVNGPGESRHSDIGISLPGAGEDPKAPVYADGHLVAILKGPELVPEFMSLLDKYVERRFGRNYTARQEPATDSTSRRSV